MLRLVTLFSLLVAVYGSAVQNRILEGQDIEIKDVPYQVSILKKISISKRYHLCGGSLLALDWVLTSSYCVEKYNTSEIVVGAGKSTIYTMHVPAKVLEIHLHPKWRSNVSIESIFDVALLKLEKTTSFYIKKEIQLAQLPTIGEPVLANTMVNITGWGVITEESTQILQVLTVPTLDDNTCKRYLKNENLEVDLETQFCCVVRNGEDSCQGDFGGPVVSIKDKIQIGIVPFKHSCGKTPGVYTKIAAEGIRDWIKDISDI